MPMPYRIRNTFMSIVCAALPACGAVGGGAGTAPADAQSAQCGGPDYRAFDFWLGEWEVRDAGKPVATSRIERTADGCAIFEHYRQADGYHGRSMNFYDAFLKEWRQSWVDGVGSVGEFRGTFSGGAMRFTGETHRSDGRRIFRRMTLSIEPGGRVRQLSFASDDGAVWRPHYDLEYVRRAPPAAQARDGQNM